MARSVLLRWPSKCLAFYSKIKCHVCRGCLQQKPYLCPCHSPCRKPQWADGGADIHIVKGVFVRFGSDDRRTSQIQRQVRNKAAKNALCGVLYAATIGFMRFYRMLASVVSIYLHWRGAFGVARFDLSGNAKAFLSWNERQTGSTFLFI